MTTKHFAEQAVLGIGLMDPTRYAEVRYLVPDIADFGHLRHRLLVQLMDGIVRAGRLPDVMAVVDEMTALPQDQLVEWGGDLGGAVAYVSSLPEMVPSVEALEHYAQIVRTHGLRRRTHEAAVKLRALAKESTDPVEMLAEAEKLLQALAGSTAKQDWVDAHNLVSAAWTEWQRRAECEGPIGIASGLYDIDREIGGWQAPNLIILAARPAMGKTAALLQFCGQACQDGVPVALLSQEMDRQQVVDRIAATWAEVPYSAVQRGKMNREQWARLSDFADRASSWPLWVDDRPRRVTELRSTVRRLVLQYGIRLLAVDYLQILTPEESKRAGKREEDVAGMARGLKALAKEFRISVIVAAQLNREVEARKDKHPVLSDLRESGAIEQEADQVLGLCRPAYYEREATPAEQAEAHFDVLKNRFGNAGCRVHTRWIPEFQRFLSMDTRRDSPPTPRQEQGYY